MPPLAKLWLLARASLPLVLIGETGLREVAKSIPAAGWRGEAYYSGKTAAGGPTFIQNFEYPPILW
jgi:hypothetical protein